MGNTSFGKLESKEKRKNRIMEATHQAKTKLKNIALPSTQLMVNSKAEQTKQALVNIMQTQLVRSGRPFTKPDLIGLLLYFRILRKQDKHMNFNFHNLTNEELRSNIRNEIYSSAETLNALKKFATIPMASNVL
tara:strand:+ start:334 stop:735 length:402 start_codon:yes stop_codon:yes gene_type:complete